MSRTRMLAAVVIVVALLATLLAVTLLQRHPKPEAAPVTTTTPPTTTPPTTTKPKPPPDQWLAIMQKIIDFRNSLYANPRPNLLSNIYQSSCPCYAVEAQALQMLQQKHWRYADQNTQLVSVRLIAHASNDPRRVELLVTSKTPRQHIVNAAGTVVQSIPSSGPTPALYVLAEESNQNWRVYTYGVIK